MTPNQQIREVLKRIEDRMIASGAFLVEKQDIAEIRALLDECLVIPKKDVPNEPSYGGDVNDFAIALIIYRKNVDELLKKLRGEQ